MRSRKKTEPGKKSAPMSMGPMIGLMAVCLVAMAGMYWWTSRHAAAPASLPSAPASVPATPASVPATPAFTPKHIYSETASPSTEIAAALSQAKREHKRVLLDFGGDWCGDCQALDIYFHQAPNADLLETNFVLVHVWIGHMDANLDVAERYGVPITKGVPALAVLAPDGRLLYAQKAGEFEDMRHMEPGSVTEFLEKWKS
jgi:thiol:disulfide interchange protein